MEETPADTEIVEPTEAPETNEPSADVSEEGDKNEVSEGQSSWSNNSTGQATQHDDVIILLFYNWLLVQLLFKMTWMIMATSTPTTC